MSFPITPLWRLENGFLVSTADSQDRGLETMVFQRKKMQSSISADFQFGSKAWILSIRLRNTLGTTQP